MRVKRTVHLFLALLLLASVMLLATCSVPPSSQPVASPPVTSAVSPTAVTTATSTPAISPAPVMTPTPTPEIPTLKSLANALGKDFGTYITPPGMENAIYMETLKQQFNLIMPSGMSMVFLQPRRGVWDFSQIDRMVNYAYANKLKVRLHGLVWGLPDGGILGEGWSPTPAWVYEGNFSREEMIKIMNDHITAVIKRYGNQVDEWIVVNESASRERTGGFANNIWRVRIGEDYIKLAYQKARELDPDATLILNEIGGDYIKQSPYGIEDNIYNHVRRLVEDGVPIDAIGLEFHLTAPIAPQYEPTIDSILANFKRYHELGLKVYVTELDVKVREPVTQEKLEIQARFYATVMEAVLLSNACSSINVWDFTDLYSWIPSHFPGYNDACLFDKYIKPKPAYDSVMDVLKKYASKLPGTKPPVTGTTPAPPASTAAGWRHANPADITYSGSIGHH